MTDVATAVIVLRPEEGKTLIGEATARLPEVEKAMKSGRVVITAGTTCRYVARALFGEDPGFEAFAAGWIHDGKLGEAPLEGRGPGPFIVERGELSRGWPGPVLERFEAHDIYIKGGNAIDAEGNIGILMANAVGGTIGAALSIVLARGALLVIPISLQKMIPSVAAVGGKLGHGRVQQFMGLPVGYMPILAGYARVVTELEALRILFGLEATLVASGGVADSVGALSVYVEGPSEGVQACFARIAELR